MEKYKVFDFYNNLVGHIHQKFDENNKEYFLATRLDGRMLCDINVVPKHYEDIESAKVDLVYVATVLDNYMY